MKPDANHDDESPSTGASESAPDYPLPADVRTVKLAHSARQRRRRRVTAGAAIGIVIAVVAAILAPPLGSAIYNVADRVDSGLFGVDHPVELKPICDHLGGIVPPPSEINAAYQWRCDGSQSTITKREIQQRCVAQWGSDAVAVLHDPNSAAGWKCHTPGLLP